MTIPPEPPGAARFRAHREEYLDHLDVTAHLQELMREDIAELAGQEGWSLEEQAGVQEWVSDMGTLWRALRRHRYDLSKAHSALLSTLTHRLSLSLHLPLASLASSAVAGQPPVPQEHPFRILPLPKYTTRLGQPIAVIALRRVVRDEHGSLVGLKEWTWTALEMVRRTVRDWWAGEWPDPDGAHPAQETGKGKQGVSRRYRGEGCVLLIDAAGAGYRNLEVELLPTLLSIGHNHYPSVFDSVLVVNAGWTHRSMWGIIKRVLPRSAIEKITFLDTPEAVAEWIQPDRLPTDLGGTADWSYSIENDTVFQRYSTAPVYTPQSHSDETGTTDGPIPPFSESEYPASRATSSASLLEFHTALNTPSHSRRTSRRNSRSLSHMHGLDQLRMSAPPERPASNPELHPGTETCPALSSSAAAGPGKRRKTYDAHRRTKPAGEGLRQEIQAEAVPVALGESAPSARSPFEDDFEQYAAAQVPPGLSTAKKSGSRSRPHSPSGMTPLQRIKSISDFHLYLSPSRLAHLDVLSDSESDSESSDGGGQRRIGNGHPRVSHRPPLSLFRRRTSPRSPIELSEGGYAAQASSVSLASPGSAPRRVLRPVVVDAEATIQRHSTLAERRARPGLSLPGVGGVVGDEGCRRTYSGLMGLHHAHVLKGYQGQGAGPVPSGLRGEVIEGESAAEGNGTEGAVRANGQSAENQSAATSSAGPDAIANVAATHSDAKLHSEPTSPAPLSPLSPLNIDLDIDAGIDATTTEPYPDPDAYAYATSIALSEPRRISAYSRSQNPFFGYPATVTFSPSGLASLAPRHARRRKRDLVKTLLFLAMLRLQTLRDGIERWLGLRGLGAVPWARRAPAVGAHGATGYTSAGPGQGPVEGLRRVALEKRERLGRVVRGGRGRGWMHLWKSGEWVWAFLGVVLMRGAWVRVLEGVMEAMGLDGAGRWLMAL